MITKDVSPIQISVINKSGKKNRRRNWPFPPHE